MYDIMQNINTRATRRFIECLRGIGKTQGMVLNIQNMIDEILLYKNEFEVLVICTDVEQKKLLRQTMMPHYNKYIEYKTMYDILYKVSAFPVNDDSPYDVPRIHQLLDKNYEYYFVDPSCYEILLGKQLDKLAQIGELL